MVLADGRSANDPVHELESGCNASIHVDNRGDTQIPATKRRSLAMESYRSAIALSLILTAMAFALPASAAQLTAKTAILVHGAFADGSSWQKVIPYLENAGLKVIAVQNPLDSLEN